MAREINEIGGEALALQVDVRFEESVNKLVSDTIAVRPCQYPIANQLLTEEKRHTAS